MRSVLKRIVEGVLVHGGITRIASRRRLRSRIVLAYHNVVPPGERPGADTSLHVPLQRFREHLDVLGRWGEVVSLPELLQSSGGGSAAPKVAITFDDAYRGAVTCGLAELARRGWPATVFVCPEYLGGRAFWWDLFPQVADAPGGRDRALDEFKGRETDVRGWMESAGFAEVNPPGHARAATIDELTSCVAAGPVTLGAHSWAHPNLAALDADELDVELARPLDWLREHYPDAMVRHLAFPYGCTNAGVERAAREAGYEAAFRVEGGFVPDESADMLSLPRLNVPAGLTADGLAIRLSGLM